MTPQPPIFYTGVGPRRTPWPILAVMERLARHLARHKWVLRSGATRGAEMAFERGCDRARGPKVIYLPWPGFRRRYDLPFVPLSPAAYRLARQCYPAPRRWRRLTRATRALLARNSYQVLGEDLTTPSRLVICWLPEGDLSAREATVATTGAEQVIRIADLYGVPVCNLARRRHLRLAWVLLTGELLPEGWLEALEQPEKRDRSPWDLGHSGARMSAVAPLPAARANTT